jgi:hypothetical protein
MFSMEGKILHPSAGEGRADNDIHRSHAGGSLAFQEFMIVPS